MKPQVSGVRCQVSGAPRFAPAGTAGGAYRAGGTLRTSRGAVACAKVHQRLVELPGRARSLRQEASGQVPRRSVGRRCRRTSLTVHTECASQDPGDVRVDGSGALFESEARDRTGGVISDTGQRHQDGGVVRECAVVMPNDRTGESVEICGSPIVAEALPGFSDASGTRICEPLDGGEAVEEPRVVLGDAADLCLLEHEFGNEHVIRIAGAPPWQVSACCAEPLEQAALEAQGIVGERTRHGGVRYTHDQPSAHPPIRLPAYPPARP